jgi:hypothetical protein
VILKTNENEEERNSFRYATSAKFSLEIVVEILSWLSFPLSYVSFT